MSVSRNDSRPGNADFPVGAAGRLVYTLTVMPELGPAAAKRTPSVTPGSGRLPDGIAPFAVPDHTLLRRIGKGAYGEVWLARNALGTWRAVKFARRSSFDDDKPFEREFAGIRFIRKVPVWIEAFVAECERDSELAEPCIWRSQRL